MMRPSPYACTQSDHLVRYQATTVKLHKLCVILFHTMVSFYKMHDPFLSKSQYIGKRIDFFLLSFQLNNGNNFEGDLIVKGKINL